MHSRANKLSSLRLLFPALALLLNACAPVGPDFVKPEIDAAAQWSKSATQGLESTAQPESLWWHIFNDPILNQLVDTARANNNSLEIAGLRVLESRAQLGVAVGALYPQQRASGSAAYLSPPENTGLTSNYWQYGLGLSAAWEIDFWGRFRRGIESADAAFMASIAAYDQALVLLTAQVVDTYTVIRATEEQLRISKENIGLQQRSYEITEVLYRNGQDSGLDMQQAKSLLLSTQATIPSLTIALKQARNALATLLGQAPGSVNALLASRQGIPHIPADVSTGFPADMLRRRPDVRQAELLAKAQNARVGLAAADLYPSFSLTGSIGLTAGGPVDDDFDNLFDADALGYSVGPSFSWPFLSYGRIKNNVRVQDARLQQALVNYRETVLQAAREAEDAMAGFSGSQQQSLILAATVSSSKRSNELSTLRFREGFSSYQRVLDAQQALFSQQQRYTTSEADKVRSLIALYKALGGGWEDRAGQPFIGEATRQVMQQRSNWGDLLDTDYSENNKEDGLPKPDW
ncbi:MAG: efflux transporter outer membrane subunit [Gammaproteobacteria bacterium]|nr:efflux transporter outer membrane subunit [Gammaproteobacteria bacterium]MBQ0839685.1 efflux transporter outer membrane subunit [Gammaproteobacteria bacterium]